MLNIDQSVVRAAAARINHSLSDIWDCMASNFLQLEDGKSMLFLIGIPLAAEVRDLKESKAQVLVDLHSHRLLRYYIRNGFQ